MIGRVKPPEINANSIWLCGSCAIMLLTSRLGDARILAEQILKSIFFSLPILCSHPPSNGSTRRNLFMFVWSHLRLSVYVEVHKHMSEKRAPAAFMPHCDLHFCPCAPSAAPLSVMQKRAWRSVHVHNYVPTPLIPHTPSSNHHQHDSAQHVRRVYVYGTFSKPSAS